MNSILAALLQPQPGGSGTIGSSTASAAQTASAPTPASSAAQFKSQFDQAVQTLTQQVGQVQKSTNATTASTTTATQAATAGSAAQTIADALQTTLQKKIADLLAQGKTVAEIVQQLAASLANTIAQQMGGDPAAIQSQLQAAFTTALTPVTTSSGSGPPSAVDLASTLAQRFRQIADVAAGVISEMGQSNRLFAGSTSDAATTAGVQPAPTATTPTDTGPTTADSMTSDAQAFLSNLTASQGDGKAVATNGPAIATNGDNLLGRILARAAQSAKPSLATQQPEIVSPAAAATSFALAAATAALTDGSIPTPAADPTSAAIKSVLTNAVTTATNSGSATAAVTVAAAPISPAVSAFLKSFTDALATTSTAVTPKNQAASDTGNSLLTTDIASAQAPTIGAFAPVQTASTIDPITAQAQKAEEPLPQGTTADSNSVVEQLVRGAFMNTVGDTSTVRLTLSPESLGDISVKLSVTGTSVSAQIMAQTPAAHDALVAGQVQLTKTLADAGLKLTGFNVDLSGGFASFQQQQGQSSQSQSNGRRMLLGGVDTPEDDETVAAVSPNFGPPVLAGSNWNNLNYLA